MKPLRCLVLMLLLSGGLAADEGDSRALDAIAAANDWLALVEAGDAEASYARAGPDFRSTVSAENWARVVASRREELGAVTVRQPTKVNYFPGPEGGGVGDWVMIRFLTGFAEREEVSETVTVIRYPEAWGVSGYYIR
jgi:hypothetical protein